MYSLFLVSIAYLFYFVYNSFFKYPEVGFEKIDEEHSFEFIKMEKYVDDNFTTEYSESKKIDSETEYIIIDYIYNDERMKFVTTDYSNYSFPMYSESEIKNRVFTRDIKSVKINDEDFTRELKYYLGPNVNFYNDIPGCEIDLSKILTTNCTSGIIEITDNIGNTEKHSLPWTPKWEPSIIKKT
jgi:hypothetical protein